MWRKCKEPARNGSVVSPIKKDIKALQVEQYIMCRSYNKSVHMGSLTNLIGPRKSEYLSCLNFRH
jgi:hypothetical protein